jgi:hypothetical protein
VLHNAAALRLLSDEHYGTSAVTADQSALMPANFTTLPHFSVLWETKVVGPIQYNALRS